MNDRLNINPEHACKRADKVVNMKRKFILGVTQSS